LLISRSSSKRKREQAKARALFRARVHFTSPPTVQVPNPLTSRLLRSSTAKSDLQQVAFFGAVYVRRYWQSTRTVPKCHWACQEHSQTSITGATVLEYHFAVPPHASILACEPFPPACFRIRATLLPHCANMNGEITLANALGMAPLLT